MERRDLTKGYLSNSIMTCGSLIIEENSSGSTPRKKKMKRSITKSSIR